jgi:glycosyltransferase involved in cell wall biosynthesis
MGNPTSPLPLLSVVIPCYNEIGTINEIVYAVAHSPYPNIEIIIVDDCSNDGTREKLKSQIAQLPEVSRVLYHDKNMGKGAALRTGFAAATGDILIVQDADLEYDPIQYPLIIEPILQGKDPKQQYRPRLTVRRTLIVLP